jgi:hypothetical protein
MINPELEKYRDLLVEADHQASLNYDKAVMTLSGGALGISITFLKDIVPAPLVDTKILLYISWTAFAVSLASILISYLFSMEGLRQTIRQVDDGTIYSRPIGGIATILTVILRILAAVGFLVGVIGFVWFALANY